MSHQQKLFPQKSEQQEEEEGGDEHETCTNLKRPPLRGGPNHFIPNQNGKFMFLQSWKTNIQSIYKAKFTSLTNGTILDSVKGTVDLWSYITPKGNSRLFLSILFVLKKILKISRL